MVHTARYVRPAPGQVHGRVPSRVACVAPPVTRQRHATRVSRVPMRVPHVRECGRVVKGVLWVCDLIYDRGFVHDYALQTTLNRNTGAPAAPPPAPQRQQAHNRQHDDQTPEC